MQVIPGILKSVSGKRGHVIFVPSYFDFVRVRNYFDAQDLAYAAISEYSPVSDISRARTAFFKGDADFLVMTERLQFFRRYHIRGARHIHFYQLPERADFYPEVVEWLIATEPGKDKVRDGAEGQVMGHVTVTYLRWDRLRLERVVGSRRLERLLEGEKGTFMFV